MIKKLPHPMRYGSCCMSSIFKVQMALEWVVCRFGSGRVLMYICDSLLFIDAVMPLLVLCFDFFLDVLQAWCQRRFFIGIALHFLELGIDLVDDGLMSLFCISNISFYRFDIVLVGSQVIVVPYLQIFGLYGFSLLHQFDDFGMVFVEFVFFATA